MPRRGHRRALEPCLERYKLASFDVGSAWLVKQAPGSVFITAPNPKRRRATAQPQSQQLPQIHYTVSIRLNLQATTYQLSSAAASLGSTDRQISPTRIERPSQPYG